MNESGRTSSGSNLKCAGVTSVELWIERPFDYMGKFPEYQVAGITLHVGQLWQWREAWDCWETFIIEGFSKNGHPIIRETDNSEGKATNDHPFEYEWMLEDGDRWTLLKYYVKPDEPPTAEPDYEVIEI